MRDIEQGCEAVITQLERWNEAVINRHPESLQAVLDPEFQLVSDPAIIPDRLDKQGFIDFQHGAYISAIDFLDITARKSEAFIATMILARVTQYEPSSADRRPVSKTRLIYSSVWRRSEDGVWRCYRHNILCPIGSDPV